MTELKYSIGSLINVKVEPLSYLFLQNNKTHTFSYFVVGFTNLEKVFLNQEGSKLITDSSTPFTGIILDGTRCFEARINTQRFIEIYKILVTDKGNALWFPENVLDQFVITI